MGYEDMNVAEPAHRRVKLQGYTSTAMKCRVSDPEHISTTSVTMFGRHHVTAVTIRSYHDPSHGQNICFVIQRTEQP